MCLGAEPGALQSCAAGAGPLETPMSSVPNSARQPMRPTRGVHKRRRKVCTSACVQWSKHVLAACQTPAELLLHCDICFPLQCAGGGPLLTQEIGGAEYSPVSVKVAMLWGRPALHVQQAGSQRCDPQRAMLRAKAGLASFEAAAGRRITAGLGGEGASSTNPGPGVCGLGSFLRFVAHSLVVVFACI